MANTAHYHTRFEEDHYYHIYNRTIDKKPMFNTDDNYRYFLEKYDEYLSPVSDLFAYCLLGNHFHCLIRIRGSEELAAFQKLSKSEGAVDAVKTTHDIVSHQFRKFFQSYAMAFNKHTGRVGTLFQTPFKRALIDSDAYFTQIVYYIHANPQQHGLIDDFRNWKWSSYRRMLLDKPTRLQKQEVLNWFGGRDAYEKYHEDYHFEIINRLHSL